MMQSQKNRIRKPAAALAASLLLAAGLSGCNSGGGHDSGPPGISGRLYLEGGLPAAHAKIRIYPSGFVPDGSLAKRGAAGAPVYSTSADGTGTFRLDRSLSGEFNIHCESEGMSSFRYSVVIHSGVAALPADTLRPSGSLTGLVVLQPMHDPRAGLAWILGSPFIMRPDSLGRFTLSGLPAGSHRLHIQPPPTDEDYTPTTLTVTVEAGKADTLEKALEPLYAGIPVPAGIAAQVDSVKGTALITWRPVHSPSLYRYELFRVKTKGNPTSPLQLIASLTDTQYTDTLYREMWNGMPDIMTFEPSTFEYRVKVRNQSDKTGESYGVAEFGAVPPHYLNPKFAFRYWDHRRDSALGEGEVRAVLSFSQRARGIASVEWFLPGETEPVRRGQYDPPSLSGEDTLRFRPGPDSLYVLQYRIRDASGKVLTNTAPVRKNRAPRFQVRANTAAFTVYNQMVLGIRATDDDGDPLSYSIENKPAWAAFDTLSGVLSGSLLPGQEGIYPGITVTVTDGAAKTVAPALELTINGTEWLRTKHILAYREGAGIAVWNGKIYIMGGIPWLNQLDFNEVLEYDPATDSITVKKSMIVPALYCTAYTLGDKIYVFSHGTRPDGTSPKWVQVYDPAADTWKGLETGEVVPVTGVVVGNSLISLSHGSTVMEYNPITNLWKARNAPARPCNQGSALVDGKVYLAGCVNSPEPLYIYDIAKDAWETRDLIQGVGQKTRLVFAWGGKVYAVGKAFKKRLDEIYVSLTAFDTGTQTWEYEDNSLPVTYGFTTGISALIGDKAYLFMNGPNGGQMGMFIFHPNNWKP